MIAINVKRGDTLTLDCTRTDANGDAVLLSGTAAAQMRLVSSGAAIALTYSVVDAAAGHFRLSAPASLTVDWALGLYKCDVEFTQGSEVYSTETFAVIVVEDITRAD